MKENLNETAIENEVIATENGQLAKVTFDLSMFEHPEQNLVTTLPSGTVEEKKERYNAISGATGRMDKIINVPFELKDVIMHPVTLVDEKTGEIQNMIRTILINDKGESFEGVSMGVISSLQRIFSIFGKPDTWEEPLSIKLVKRDTRNGNKVTSIVTL